MAIPTYATVIDTINTFIVANGNNEITAEVLNPILTLITDFSNNTIGDLDTLTTSDKTTIVNAINSLKLAFDNLNNSGVQLKTGYDDPNVTPPTSFNYADFFMELDVVDDSPIQLWQWNGTEWVTYSSVYSKSEIDFLLNNLPRFPSTPFKFIQKGFGNTDLDSNEIGDIFCGWSNDGTIRISEGKWLGGALTDSDNFTPLVQTEI